MHPLIESHRAELLALARRRGVTGIRVFGSMSRDDSTDSSDVDLLVTLAPGTSALALGGLLLDAQELLGRVATPAFFDFPPLLATQQRRA